MKDKIEFKEFLEIEKKLEIKMGNIEEVERMEGSDKMLKLSVDFGDSKLVTVMTNIGNTPELSDEDGLRNLEMKSFPFITNLKPAKMMGIESHAMIMVSQKEDGTIEGVNDFYSPGAKIL